MKCSLTKLWWQPVCSIKKRNKLLVVMIHTHTHTHTHTPSWTYLVHAVPIVATPHFLVPIILFTRVKSLSIITTYYCLFFLSGKWQTMNTSVSDIPLFFFSLRPSIRKEEITPATVGIDHCIKLENFLYWFLLHMCHIRPSFEQFFHLINANNKTRMGTVYPQKPVHPSQHKLCLVVPLKHG